MTSDNGIASMAEAIAEEADPDEAPPSSAAEKWPAALATLVSARIAIISAESGQAISIAAKKALWAAIAAFCLLSTWVALLVGMIGWIAQLTGLAWFYILFLVAALHFVVALISIALLKKKSSSVFGITKSEFTKDKQWLSSVKQAPTSRNS